MAETRKQLKERLVAAGKWSDYVDLRQRLIKEGLRPAEARKQALAEIDSLPPKAAAPEQPSAGASRDSASVSDIELPDFNGQVPNHEAVQWVGENLVKSNVRPEDAPSGLAWGAPRMGSVHARQQDDLLGHHLAQAADNRHSAEAAGRKGPAQGRTLPHMWQ
jgi:hypothetical protein